MKPIDFKDRNIIIAKDQKDYKPLPALKFNDKAGTMILCVGLSMRERIRVLFTGKIWSTWTFNKPVYPVLFSTKRTATYTRPSDRDKKGWPYYLRSAVSFLRGVLFFKSKPDDGK